MFGGIIILIALAIEWFDVSCLYLSCWTHLGEIQRFSTM